MKKLNLKNQGIDDDEKLINLLKTSISQEPSKQFVENTLKKFLALNTKEKKIHKPLKSPLYLMLGVGLILFAPAFFSFGSQVSIFDFEFELKNFIQSISFEFNLWYTLPLMLPLLVLMCFVWIELGLIKFRNPFV